MNRIPVDGLYQSLVGHGATAPAFVFRKWPVLVWRKSKRPSAAEKLAFSNSLRTDRPCRLGARSPERPGNARDPLSFREVARFSTPVRAGGRRFRTRPPLGAEFCEGADCFDCSGPDEHGLYRRVLPGLKAIRDPLFWSNQRDCINQLVRHHRHCFSFVAAKVKVLNLSCFVLVAKSGGVIVVEVFRASPHPADVQGEIPLDGHPALL